jgi:REP-associated tyrosine transposase
MWHVMSRGNYKQDVFFADDDRHRFLALLSRAAQRHGWEVLAYCLMTTHYHLVLTTPSAGLSPGMRQLNGGYSRQTHRRLDRAGHLFQNRFLSESIADEQHLYESCRYVVLNPVRAGLCIDPSAWPWSSYRACAGIDVSPSFLAEGALLKLFGREVEAARRDYRAFVAAGARSFTW